MAERLNRTLKEDFNVKGFISFCEALEVIERVIKTYDDLRLSNFIAHKTLLILCCNGKENSKQKTS